MTESNTWGRIRLVILMLSRHTILVIQLLGKHNRQQLRHNYAIQIAWRWHIRRQQWMACLWFFMTTFAGYLVCRWARGQALVWTTVVSSTVWILWTNWWQEAAGNPRRTRQTLVCSPYKSRLTALMYFSVRHTRKPLHLVNRSIYR